MLWQMCYKGEDITLETLESMLPELCDGATFELNFRWCNHIQQTTREEQATARDLTFPISSAGPLHHQPLNTLARFLWVRRYFKRKGLANFESGDHQTYQAGKAPSGFKTSFATMQLLGAGLHLAAESPSQCAFACPHADEVN